MTQSQPDDALIWYGLANEYMKNERWREAAETLTHVVKLDENYTAAYQMLGTARMNMGEHAEARRAWTKGIEVAARTGAWKARQHMEGLLARAEENSSAEKKAGGDFCQ